ncbi:MAG TPA: homoserine O-succinyltransferase [Clostridia bacterium]|nr:homoserine O-succinyltransferase [Clostridia bacterium]
MPIVIPKDIPAFDILTKENIFCMHSSRAEIQDIRPLEVLILNLMPTKVMTETQLMRLLSNSPLQVNVTLLQTVSYQPTNTSQKHMDKFYKSFDDIKDMKFDGMIVTGAPVETMDFSEVKYWEELCKIFDYAERNVTSSIFICWGAQAALNYYYGIGKRTMPKKLFGVFENHSCLENEPLLKGLDDTFNIPHSRYTEIDEKSLCEDGRLVVIAAGKECGISIVKCIDNRKIFFFGHAEYDAKTLLDEYLRDIEKGLDIEKPKNYFTDENDLKSINISWRSTGNLLFYNWLNYYLYQVTPYNIGRESGN